MEEPRIKVGICDGYREIQGGLNGTYRSGGRSLTGAFTVRPAAGAASLCDPMGREIIRGRELRLTAERGATFILKEVTIGVRFHWERRREQTFAGDLVFLATEEGLLIAVNEIAIEDYLTSVVASEMNSEAPYPFLMAHAIASRSWLVAMLQRGKEARPGGREAAGQGPGEIVRWYDREDHARFDVCADDHCQRYQGMTGRIAGQAAAAVRETRGVFLVHHGGICDARYHKCCGGMTEDYATCWEDRAVPYLSHRVDAARARAPILSEAEARQWILSRPEAYCRTEDQGLLQKILPDFDRETTDFFRWEVRFSQGELAAILLAKSGIDFGRLHALVPLVRGPSGRIRRLRIEGSKATAVVGKELEIRRWLSPSHLYSSAFIVCPQCDASGMPISFILKGAGWGHGVGLCQIGAAVMASRGASAEEILRHYFQGTALVKRY